MSRWNQLAWMKFAVMHVHHGDVSPQAQESGAWQVKNNIAAKHRAMPKFGSTCAFCFP